MTVQFQKYQGAGNDFIIIDNREHNYTLTEAQIAFLCHRRFGIGADGLMLLNGDPGHDFRMRYYNSDGLEGSMCGNGGRCLVDFAFRLGLITTNTRFIAVDGLHEAEVLRPGYIRLRMSDVSSVQEFPASYFLNTGSPHHVEFVNDVKQVDVFNRGREIRYSASYQPAGTNVNYVQIMADGSLFVRTYERGVEEETLSCGTGVTASSLCAAIKLDTDKTSFAVQTLGGKLEVRFKRLPGNAFTGVYLEGPATCVFKGEITI